MTNECEICFSADGSLLSSPIWLDSTIAHFIQVDIQKSPSYCVELLGIVRKIRSGELASWGGVGNAYNIEVGAEGVVIQEEWTDHPSVARLTLGQFESAVAAWHAHLQSQGVNPDQ